MSESESLVERVARALDPLAWAALGLADTEKLAFRRKRSMEQAVAAIQAMRVPTAAALVGLNAGWRAACSGQGQTEDAAEIIWRHMIDAALA